MTTFDDRQRVLFEKLLAAEESNPKPNNHRQPPERCNVPMQWSRKMRNETKHFRGRKSLFSRPEDSISRCLGARNPPDYQKNPQKWTHYSLEDVPDVTDRSNAIAAAICQEEIRNAKQKQTVNADNDAVDDKIVFKLPVPVSRDIRVNHIEKDQKTIIYRNSKIVLPEYIVGKDKRKPSNRNKYNQSESKKSNLKLDHLNCTGDDDDDNDDENFEF